MRTARLAAALAALASCAGPKDVAPSLRLSPPEVASSPEAAAPAGAAGTLSPPPLAPEPPRPLDSGAAPAPEVAPAPEASPPAPEASPPAPEASPPAPEASPPAAGPPAAESVEAQPEPPCAPELLVAAADADRRLRTLGTCAREDLAALSAAVAALSECAGALKPAPWVFPVAGVGLESLGGQGTGYVRSTWLPCYATPSPGHPAHDIFVDDPRHQSRDLRGEPFLARAVEEGRVLIARGGWTPEDPGRGGNYVMLVLPARRLIAYYAHLETIRVRPGERVLAGQAVGTIGRTGKNAWPHRSPTHLHFGVWDARTFVPTNPLALLRAARLKAPEPSR